MGSTGDGFSPVGGSRNTEYSFRYLEMGVSGVVSSWLDSFAMLRLFEMFGGVKDRGEEDVPS